jgi:lysyl-tRNA synthetase class II
MDAADFIQSYSSLSSGQSLPTQDVRQNGRVVAKREAGSKLIFIDIVGFGAKSLLLSDERSGCPRSPTSAEGVQVKL